MACPLCGDHCRCSYVAPSAQAAGDGDRLADEFPPAESDSVLVDPEAWDDTEEQFAASVSEAAAVVAQRARPPAIRQAGVATATDDAPTLDSSSHLDFGGG